MTPQEKLRTEFRARYGEEPRIFRAPGRVNVIGEHTDYNQGFVMPAAIGLASWVAVSPREDHTILASSLNFPGDAELSLDRRKPTPNGKWSDYIYGVAVQLEKQGHRLTGANVLVEGEVPIGAGLSSSASLEVAAAMGLAALIGEQLEATELALLCQAAENDFVGARCGVMDQFIACHGRAGHVLRLDCRDLSYRLLPLPEHVKFVVANTMIRHEISAGKYNKRCSECEQSVDRLRIALPIESLRDVTMETLEEQRDHLSKTLYKRARHVVTENERVRQAEAALEEGDAALLGKLMSESHVSLRDDYEVSCAQSDILADLLEAQPGVYGARMMGGGFGGSVIALADADRAGELRAAVAADYADRTGLDPWFYVCETADGASEATT